MNEMRVNNSEMCTRSNNEAWSKPEISVPRSTKEEKNSEREGFLTLYEKEKLKDQKQASFMFIYTRVKLPCWQG